MLCQRGRRPRERSLREQQFQEVFQLVREPVGSCCRIELVPAPLRPHVFETRLRPGYSKMGLFCLWKSHFCVDSVHIFICKNIHVIVDPPLNAASKARQVEQEKRGDRLWEAHQSHPSSRIIWFPPKCSPNRTVYAFWKIDPAAPVPTRIASQWRHPLCFSFPQAMLHFCGVHSRLAKAKGGCNGERMYCKWNKTTLNLQNRAGYDRTKNSSFWWFCVVWGESETRKFVDFRYLTFTYVEKGRNAMIHTKYSCSIL